MQYIIWEADDNQDGVIDRSEFEQTFLRNMADLTNKEPRELYNIIQVRLLLSVKWIGRTIDWNRWAERWREGA
jgi:hypothetical protein